MSNENWMLICYLAPFVIVTPIIISAVLEAR